MPETPLPRIVKSLHLSPPVTVTRQVLHEMAVEYALERHRQSGSLDPTWVMSDGHNVTFMETPFDSPRHKQGVAFVLATEFFPTIGVKVYSFVSEAWVWAGKHTDEDHETEKAFINEHGVGALPKERRDEVIVITTNDRSDHTMFTRFLLTPRRRGPALVGPRVDEEIEDMEGNFINLLKKGKET
jgi:hypothetical protein